MNVINVLDAAMNAVQAEFHKRIGSRREATGISEIRRDSTY
jgi:hypothetical protein